MEKKISQLRTFFRVSNAAFEFQNSIQFAFSGHIVPNEMQQLHKVALFEIEKENPDLSLIDNLLAEMENDNLKHKAANESFTQGYNMYTGISLKQWDNVWKDKNLTDRETNVTDDKLFAFNYSYDFKAGKYDDVIVEISNIPLDAFVAYRVGNTSEEETYADDDDFHTMNGMSNDEKKNIIDNYSLFLVSLYKYKNIISTKLLKRKL